MATVVQIIQKKIYCCTKNKNLINCKNNTEMFSKKMATVAGGHPQPAGVITYNSTETLTWTINCNFHL